MNGKNVKAHVARFAAVAAALLVFCLVFTTPVLGYETMFYDNNGEDLGSDYYGKIDEETYVYSGGTIPTITREGCTFLGWGLQDNDETLLPENPTTENWKTFIETLKDSLPSNGDIKLYPKWVENKKEVIRDTAISNGQAIDLTLNTTTDNENFLLTIPPSIAMSYDKESGNYIAEATISLSNIVVNATAPKDLSVNVESTNGFKLMADDSNEEYKYILVANQKKSDDVDGDTLEGILLFDYSVRDTYTNGVISSDMTFTHFANFIQLAKLDAKDTLTFKVEEVAQEETPAEP